MGNLGEGQETGWLVSQHRQLRHRLSIRFSNKKRASGKSEVKNLRVVPCFALKNTISSDLQWWRLGPGHGEHHAHGSGELRFPGACCPQCSQIQTEGVKQNKHKPKEKRSHTLP